MATALMAWRFESAVDMEAAITATRMSDTRTTPRGSEDLREIVLDDVDENLVDLGAIRQKEHSVDDSGFVENTSTEADEEDAKNEADRENRGECDC